MQRGGLQVELAAPGVAVKHPLLSWKANLVPNWKYLGDTWERAYGDREWKPLDVPLAPRWPGNNLFVVIESIRYHHH